MNCGKVGGSHGYEMFLYTVRGHVINVNQMAGMTSFNIEPSVPHVSDMNIDGEVKPSITLIGRRLVKTVQGIVQEDDVFPVLESTTFVCDNAPAGMRDGDYHELHINEAEAQRIKPLIADPNLVLNVAGIL